MNCSCHGRSDARRSGVGYCSLGQVKWVVHAVLKCYRSHIQSKGASKTYTLHGQVIHSFSILPASE